MYIVLYFVYLKPKMSTVIRRINNSYAYVIYACKFFVY